MSNGDPPVCDAACQKLILNGDIAGDVISRTCERIEAFKASGQKFRNPLRTVEAANKIEDEAFKFERVILEEMGFTGPWSHALS